MEYFIGSILDLDHNRNTRNATVTEEGIIVVNNNIDGTSDGFARNEYTVNGAPASSYLDSSLSNSASSPSALNTGAALASGLGPQKTDSSPPMQSSSLESQMAAALSNFLLQNPELDKNDIQAFLMFAAVGNGYTPDKSYLDGFAELLAAKLPDVSDEGAIKEIVDAFFKNNPANFETAQGFSPDFLKKRINDIFKEIVETGPGYLLENGTTKESIMDMLKAYGLAFINPENGTAVESPEMIPDIWEKFAEILAEILAAKIQDNPTETQIHDEIINAALATPIPNLTLLDAKFLEESIFGELGTTVCMLPNIVIHSALLKDKKIDINTRNIKQKYFVPEIFEKNFPIILDQFAQILANFYIIYGFNMLEANYSNNNLNGKIDIIIDNIKKKNINIDNLNKLIEQKRTAELTIEIEKKSISGQGNQIASLTGATYKNGYLTGVTLYSGEPFRTVNDVSGGDDDLLLPTVYKELSDSYDVPFDGRKAYYVAGNPYELVSYHPDKIGFGCRPLLEKGTKLVLPKAEQFISKRVNIGFLFRGRRIYNL